MLLSLGVILFLSIRKFPMLANLDIDTIQAEREAKFKEQIIGKRLKRSIFERKEVFSDLWFPIRNFILELFHAVIKKLIDIKEEHAKTPNILTDSGLIANDLVAAEKMVTDGDYDEAEKKYITIISKDSKNIQAFKDLGGLYLERKKFVEASETLKHAAKLAEKALRDNPEDGSLKNQLAEMYFSLADCGRELNNSAQAMNFLNDALSIYPLNPRYLDMKLEISIISGDKKTAESTLAQLKGVNPENGKIADFRERIESIEE